MDGGAWGAWGAWESMARARLRGWQGKPRRELAAYLVVVPQQLVEKVNGFIRDKTLVFRGDKAVPGLLLKAAEDVVVLGVELNLVAIEVVEEVVGAENLCDLDELVRVTVAVKEGFFAEDHRGKHGAEAPHVEAVVVFLEVDEELGALEVA